MGSYAKGGKRPQDPPERLERLGVAAAMSIAGDAGAQTIIDMKGTWSTTGQAVVQNGGAHHPANEPGKAVGEYRLREVKFSYRIEGQDGTRFWASVIIDPIRKTVKDKYGGFDAVFSR